MCVCQRASRLTKTRTCVHRCCPQTQDESVPGLLRLQPRPPSGATPTWLVEGMSTFDLQVARVKWMSHTFCSVLFCSVLLCSVMFCSVLFCNSVPPPTLSRRRHRRTQGTAVNWEAVLELRAHQIRLQVSSFVPSTLLLIAQSDRDGRSCPIVWLG